MTNNNLDIILATIIDELVQGRDIEKAFDHFIETVTDSIIDQVDVDVDLDDDDEALVVIDYIIDRVMARFNYRLALAD